jgi:TRAP-type C4-dicarboxylate transport system substrate-binding protein
MLEDVSRGSALMREANCSPSVDGTNKRRCTTMQTRWFTRYALAAVLAASAMTVAACSGSSGDKAGGAEKQEPVVLKLASITGDIQPPLQVFADEVARRSNQTLRIEFKPEWRGGDPDAERGTIKDVKAGKVDMAWVGARVFDRLGVRNFQALLAPLLVDSYELEGRVFESGITTSMLDGVDELGVVGIGVLPGQMRRLLGVSHPFLRPSDFDGQVIGGAKNELAGRTFRALGATLEALPVGGSLEGLDATETHLEGIWSNRYNKSAKYVGANVNLWPRPLVIFSGKEVFESLSPEQQDVLREAATAAIPEALAGAREEDDNAALQLCRRGMTFAVASESELTELRTALEPVYAELMADAETNSNIEAITDLKTEIAASAETPACTSTEPEATASRIPDGTYETTLTRADWAAMTKADWLKSGVSEEDAANPGVFRMTFNAGEWSLLGPIGEVEAEDAEEGSYTVYRDEIVIEIAADYKITARWSRKGDSLTFTDVDCCGGNAKIETVMMTSHPWVKTS